LKILMNGSVIMPDPVSGLAAATAGSALVGASASRSAANAQAGAAQAGIAAQERMFDRQVELNEPWRKAGEEALNKLIPLTDYKKFDMSQFQADPGYAFRLSEGMKALDRTAAARGGLLSGATLKGAQRFGQDLGSQEYQNAFNRAQIERAAQLQPLQSLAGVGQTAAGTLTNAAGQMGQNYATGYGNMGQARASGYVGGANALTSALGTGANFYQNQQYINRLPIAGSGFGVYRGTPGVSGDFNLMRDRG
jgi:hypothetical protein